MTQTLTAPAKKQVRPAMEHVTATYQGKTRPGYRNGGRYRVVLHRCAGHVFRDGMWRPDDRVQIYRPDADTPGYIMYPSMEDLQKDFAI